MPIPLASFDGKRILIVGGTGILTAMVRECLDELGTELVGPIGRPEEAVSIIKAARPDAAIVDLSLPAETAVWFDDLLNENEIPYVFAQAKMPSAPADAAGFYLVNDDAQLGAIATALFAAEILH